MAAEEPKEPFRAPMGTEPAPLDEEAELRAARNANRFDIRRIIGGLFTLYGVVLTITGIVGAEHVKTKAAGVNIDLWTGIGLIVFGVIMIAWALARPTQPEPPERRGEGSGRTRRAPA